MYISTLEKRLRMWVVLNFFVECKLYKNSAMLPLQFTSAFCDLKNNLLCTFGRCCTYSLVDNAEMFNFHFASLD